MSERAAARERIIRRTTRMIAELEQCLRDIRYYNEHVLPPGEPPIDSEVFRVDLHLARKIRQHAENWQNIPDELMARFLARATEE